MVRRTKEQGEEGDRRMIPVRSEHVKRKGRQTEIVCMSQEEQTISGRDCLVSVAVTRSSSGGEYVTIVYIYPDHPRYDFATCNCQGWYFKSICGHVSAVLDKATGERV